MKKTFLPMILLLLISLLLAGTAAGLEFTQSDLLCQIDYDGGTDPVYIGYAKPGSADTANTWQIRKLIYDGSGNVTATQFANGDNGYKHVWNDRASYTYK